MSYQVLARKWRPKRFADVVGQEHVTRSLQNALRTKKLAHAYLFTGTRGVGKTSIARLFAKAIRCENPTAEFDPCGLCGSCKDIDLGNSLDYLEIDGASHTGVDNVRELIDNVQYLPARGAHKIYVIDEVHMLSNSAFNALLKTLEEPPAHAIFFFATTDVHKILGTVLSRCQRFDFKNVPVEILASHLAKVSAAEGIQFTSPDLARKLAQYAKGSVRDMLSLLDQILSLAGGAPISEEVFFHSLGLARSGAIGDIVAKVLTEKPLEAGQVLRQLIDENLDLKRVVDQLLERFYEVIQLVDAPEEVYRRQLLPSQALAGLSYSELFWVYETFAKDAQWALGSLSPEKVVEISLHKLARRRQMLRPDASLIGASPHQASPDALPEKKTPELNARIADLIEALHDAPTIRANLELGDYLEKPVLVDGELRIVVGFRASDAMAKDYLSDPDVLPKFKKLTAEFFAQPQEGLRLRLELLGEAEASERGFTSYAEREARRTADEVEGRRQSIANHPYVKEAERLFNSKVDKIVLKDIGHES